MRNALSLVVGTILLCVSTVVAGISGAIVALAVAAYTVANQSPMIQ